MKNKIYLVLILLFSFIFIGKANAATLTGIWNGPIMQSVEYATYVSTDGYKGGFQTYRITTSSASALSPVQIKMYPVGAYSGQQGPVNINTNTGLIRFQAYASYNANTNDTTMGISTGLNASIRVSGGGQIVCYPYTSGSITSFECPVAKEMQGKEVQWMLFQFQPSTLGLYLFGLSDVIQSFRDDNLTQQETNNKLDNIDTSINSSNTSGGESAADDLKNNSAFQDNSGLSSVVSMPLTFVNSLSNTCQPISLNIPYFDVDMQIPCFQSIITDKMPALANIIKVVINGFIIYRVLLDIFQIIRNAKNPEDDRIEVLDL